MTCGLLVVVERLAIYAFSVGESMQITEKGTPETLARSP